MNGSYHDNQPNTAGRLTESERRELEVAREATNFMARWGYPRVVSEDEARDRAACAAALAELAMRAVRR